MLVENNDIAGVKKYVKDGNHLEDIYGNDGTPLLRAMRLYHYDDQIVMALLNAYLRLIW